MAFEARLPGTQIPVHLDTSRPPDIFLTHIPLGDSDRIRRYVSNKKVLPVLPYPPALSVAPLSDALEIRKDPKTLETISPVLYMAPRITVDEFTRTLLTDPTMLELCREIHDTTQLQISEDGLSLRDPKDDALQWGLLRNGKNLLSTHPLLEEEELPELSTGEIVHIRGEYGHNYVAWPLFTRSLPLPDNLGGFLVDGIYMLLYNSTLVSGAEYDSVILSKLDEKAYDGKAIRAVIDPYIILSLSV